MDNIDTQSHTHQNHYGLQDNFQFHNQSEWIPCSLT